MKAAKTNRLVVEGSVKIEEISMVTSKALVEMLQKQIDERGEQHERALQVLQAMRRQGVPPAAVTCSAVRSFLGQRKW